MNMQSVLKSNFQIETNSGKAVSQADGYVYILASSTASQRKSEFNKIIDQHANPVQKKQLLSQSDKRVLTFAGADSMIWILQCGDIKKGQHSGLLDESSYAWFRDQSGALTSQFKTQQLQKIVFCFYGETEPITRAVIIGLEMSVYNFLNSFNKVETKLPKIVFKSMGKKKIKIDQAFLEKSLIEARSIQLARHLVNLPPNVINPQSIEDVVRKQLGFTQRTKIEVWDHKKLAQENMNLLLAVGQGSETLPRMIRISHRPGKKSSKKPIAFVGKGITFDTGGLDIKPSAGMRLMKKDMGGAAAVLALAYWAAHSDYKRPCDFYLALAENSVDAKAMRPSDLYRSRAGYLVEIDNTDAEGRLVLADVMDVAATQQGVNEPEFLIDIATLTGAIKVALGADVAGLFTNDDQLAQQLQAAGQATGESNWRMPLVQKYFNSMSSNFADFKNSADGFGGAITAALFLEKFCGGKKWAHLDVYCWNDKTTGALGFAGASGQPVQSMIEWLKARV